MQLRKSDLKKVVREVLNENEIRSDEALVEFKLSKMKNLKTKEDAHKQLLQALTIVTAVKRWVDSQKRPKMGGTRISKKLDVIATSLTDSIDAIDEELE
jgi:light-regulated signal transduction histidine kinase (bacteriophytochrome)|tara:strand:- start:786 stop:1082 length:297 start_codon:yes stop_codon:yes gene_type:complete